VSKISEYKSKIENSSDSTSLQCSFFLEAKAPCMIKETDERGWLEYAVVVDDDYILDFWLEAFDSFKDAVDFCNYYGLPIVN
jgi:hypothetical protein